MKQYTKYWLKHELPGIYEAMKSDLQTLLKNTKHRRKSDQRVPQSILV